MAGGAAAAVGEHRIGRQARDEAAAGEISADAVEMRGGEQAAPEVLDEPPVVDACGAGLDALVVDVLLHFDPHDLFCASIDPRVLLSSRCCTSRVEVLVQRDERLVHAWIVRAAHSALDDCDGPLK